MNLIGGNPKQVLEDKLGYVKDAFRDKRKPIAPAVALVYDNGIVLVAENNRRFLNKIKKVSARHAFMGVGNDRNVEKLARALLLRVGATRLAFSEHEIRARDLAYFVSDIIDEILNLQLRPLVAEVVVGELNSHPALYKVDYTGQAHEERRFATLADDTVRIKGQEEHQVAFMENMLRNRYNADFADSMPTLSEAVKLARSVLQAFHTELKKELNYQVIAENLEAAVLDQERSPEHYYKLSNEELEALLNT